MSKIGPLLHGVAATKRLRELPLTLDCWFEIEEYDRRRWGVRGLVVEPYVRQNASTAASKVGVMLSLIGVDDWAKRLDADRRVSKGDTVALLDRVTTRRNKIAHEGDRVGRGRANLTIAETGSDLAALESVVASIERVVA